MHVRTLKVDGPRQPSPEGRQQRKVEQGEGTLRVSFRTSGTKLTVVRRGEVGTRLSQSMVTAMFREEEVGKVMLSRKRLIEIHRTKKGEEDGASGFNLHAQREGDRLRLQVLMERYGEEYNMVNLPAWVREPDHQDNEPDSPSTSGGVAVLEQWVRRRSDDDVTAFRKWFNDMYLRDPGVGMKMLDWKMPSIWDLPDHTGSGRPRVPTEWTRLKQPTRSLHPDADDDEEALLGEGRLRGAEGVFRRLIQKRTGVDSEFIQVAEFCLTMAVLSVGLIYGPSFATQWVQRSPDRDPNDAVSLPVLPSGVGGVDAYLIQTDFSADFSKDVNKDLSKESIDMPNGLSHCDRVHPNIMGKCDSREAPTLAIEMRTRVKGLIKQGKRDNEILKTLGLASSAPDLPKMRADLAKEDAKAKKTDGASHMPSFNWRRLLESPRYEP